MIEPVLEEFPPGTDLRGGYDDLKAWGGQMAHVVSPDYGSAYESEFDPQIIALKYTIWLSDIPADERLVGVRFDLKYGNRPYHEQPFYFRRPGVGWGVERTETGQFRPPFSVWVKISKFSDLSPAQTAKVVSYMQSHGFREPRRYPLSAPKWRKLLSMGFEDTQTQDDYDLANAADELAPDAYAWDQIQGVYVLTKKGDIKFVVSKRRGLIG